MFLQENKQRIWKENQKRNADCSENLNLEKRKNTNIICTSHVVCVKTQTFSATYAVECTFPKDV